MSDQLCVEYHHYRGGMREVYIVTPDGHGIAFDAQHIAGLRDMLTGLERAEVGEGRVAYLTMDEKGSTRFEEGVQHG